LRVVLGAGLVMLLAREWPAALPEALHRSYSPLADWAPIHAIAASQAAWNAVHGSALAAAAMFAIGFRARASYAALVALLLADRLAWLHVSGGHHWVCPMAILVSLLAIPWGASSSLDARRAARPAPGDERSPLYGLAVWAPAVVMGLAFCAAAYAKLSTSGLAWITGGAVRYHFVEDAEAAATTWGLWIASRPAVSIVFAAGAVALEAGWILGIVARRPGVRLAVGLAALSLFLGFYVFQGMLWLPWVLCLAVWLPLDGWRTLPSAPLSGRPVAVAAGALAVQIAASASGVELEPLVSPYAMYSETYASTQDFEQKRRRKFQRIQATVGDVTVDVDGEAGDVLLMAISTPPSAPAEDLSAVLARLCADPASDAVNVRADLTRLDWTTPLVSRTTRTITGTVACPGVK
jgi:hypothetical protein